MERESTGADFTAVVVAAGRSTRFDVSRPKQYNEIAGRSILQLSVEAMLACPAVRGVVVVLPVGDVHGAPGDTVRAWPGVVAVVPGGAARFDSVLAGVLAAPDASFVLVHDAARPAVTRETIERVIEATRAHGAAIPVLEIVDTVKRLDGRGRVAATLDRDSLRLAQTPQGFRADLLRPALERARTDEVRPTDEASALERIGCPVVPVPGDPANRKITSIEDLDPLRRAMEGEAMSMRVGSGFDIHRFGGGRPLVLGGITFEGQPGLEGHSDADVVLHAAMDALLGAASLGDIGAHFPPGDPQWKDAASTGLASRVAALLAAGGWDVVNLDLTLLSERPRIREQVMRMRQSIAVCLDMAVERVGLKATTLEGLGALGRGEGMACQAVCLLRRRGV